MGVPKFYRWISERYPNISRVISDNQIPDIDNFYLDMNGIIHACSHVNNDNCESYITEEEIFRNIFHYIDFLFRMIKPRKVFLMAVDGVAPRAKLNQQRARRFRAGRDRIKKLKAFAEKTGQTLKETMAYHFDTNAITPGTKFMANLDEQLRYFINVKLTTDPLWEGVHIHLSGHLTPGEGEHKIMEFIRYTRSQPGYDMNTRHCLYGLDADLIMLGLVTHETHFVLLREEVKYGVKKISKIPAPEEINWHLLYLCLLRDYIDLEFRSVKEKIQFRYDLESIVDDWILMGYLVGNDFIPHLPHVHINQEALPLLWETYKRVLPTLDGYMNELGELNLSRFQTYLTELSKYDYDRFEKEHHSVEQLHKMKASTKKHSEIYKDQVPNSGFSVDILEKLMIRSSLTSNKEFNVNNNNDSNDQMIDNFTVDELKLLNVSSSSSSDNVHPPFYPDANDDEMSSSGSGELSAADNEKSQSLMMTSKIIFNESDYDNKSTIEAEFRRHKSLYYHDKMKCQLVSTEQLQIYVRQYIEALQWILKYYYEGCPSWSWFYPHHYAPYLSDLTNFQYLKFTFQKGTPFRPFEQLLGVLPPTSCYLLPSALQPLMTDAESPLLHFYPEDFQLDQNEKKQDWEAVVLLPFIDEQLLLNSVQKYYTNLDANEKTRNQYLPSLCFKSISKLHPTSNTLANNPYFPALKETRAVCTEYPIDYYRPNSLKFKHGRFGEHNMRHFPKFPVLNVLPYKFNFKKGVVDLFESRSKSNTLVLNLTNKPDNDCIIYNDNWNSEDDSDNQSFQITNRQLLVSRYLGKRVFVNWPHFEYGIVCAISDFRYFYTWSNIPGGSCFIFRPLTNDDNQDNKNFTSTPIYVSRCPFEISDENSQQVLTKIYTLDSSQIQMEYTKAINISRRYENRQGITIGPIPLLLYVCQLIGYRTKCISISDKCQTTMCFSNQALPYPLQTTIFNIPNYKYDSFQFPQTIHDYFKVDDPVFSLQTPHYSCMGHVQQIINDDNGKYMIACRMGPLDVVNQPDIHSLSNKLYRLQLNYWTAQDVAAYLQTMPHVVSRLTGTIIVTSGTRSREHINRVNVGFSWKGNKPVKQLYGYTKRTEQTWFYSDAAVHIISDYMLQFPEVIAELIRKPKDDTYPELNIWPTKKGKSRLQEVRIWIKNLPTYSMALMDGAWKVLDAPVIKEIDRITKLFYTKHSTKSFNEGAKLISLEPNRLFKPSEACGMCESDLETGYALYDRVITVRLGAGVPLGTRGTIIGIMVGRTHLDTYYEVLFDYLPKNSLDSILLGKNNQQIRIKVRSYHLLNYSHSLRAHSTYNYQQQRSIPTENVWEKRLLEQSSVSRQIQGQQQQQQHPTRILKRTSNDTDSATTAKSASSATSTQEKLNFVEAKHSLVREQSSTADSTRSVATEKAALSQSTATNISLGLSPQKASLPSTLNKKFSESEINSLSTTTPSPAATVRKAPVTAFPTNLRSDSLLLRAIEESKQIPNLVQQRSNTQPSLDQQQWDPTLSTQLAMAPKKRNDMSTSGYQSSNTMPASSIEAQQPEPTDSVVSHHQILETSTHQPVRNSLFAQAIESMLRAPPPSLSFQSEHLSPTNASPQSQSFHQQQQRPLSILQRAIEQSDQQLNTSQTFPPGSNSLNSLPSFQSLDSIPPNIHPGFPIEPSTNQVLYQYQPRPSPVQSNNISIVSSEAISNPNVFHNSPSSQPQAPKQTSSPRTSGGSTLQFVPSQVLRNMPRSHK